MEPATEKGKAEAGNYNMHCSLTLDTLESLDFLNGSFSLRVLPSPADTWHLFAHDFYLVTLSLLTLMSLINHNIISDFLLPFHKICFLFFYTFCNIVVGECHNYHQPYVIPSFFPWWNWIGPSKFVAFIVKPYAVDGLVALKCDKLREMLTSASGALVKDIKW